MTKVVVVTSGKGGVGKTTSSAAIGLGLAIRGKKTCVIDFDIGLRNLDLITGVERRVIYDFIHVINGEAKLNQALIKSKSNDNFFILAASQTRDKDALTREGVGKVIEELKAKDFDYIVCDSPAGIEAGAQMALYFADEAVVVTNPEVSSVRDSDRMIGMLASRTQRSESDDEPVKEHLLITRYNPARATNGEMLKVDDIKEILGNINVIGVIPEDEKVMDSSNQGMPVILSDSQASDAYKDVVSRIVGEEKPLRFINEEKSFLKRLFGG